MDEGRLKAIEEKIGAGDFLFIQFGHNDEKKEDPTRYTEPFPLTWRILKPLSVWQKIIALIRC